MMFACEKLCLCQKLIGLHPLHSSALYKKTQDITSGYIQSILMYISVRKIKIKSNKEIMFRRPAVAAIDKNTSKMLIFRKNFDDNLQFDVLSTSLSVNAAQPTKYLNGLIWPRYIVYMKATEISGIWKMLAVLQGTAQFTHFISRECSLFSK